MKRALDPAVEARSSALLGAVKRARDLDALCAALVALAEGGEAGAEAQRRLQLPFRSFGGPPPAEAQALSWDDARMLVVDEGLASARVVPRRGPNADQPEASNDEQADTRPPGASPDEVRSALIAALRTHAFAILRVQVFRGPRGEGRVILHPLEGPRQVLLLDPEAWGQPVADIVSCILEAMTLRD